MDAYLAGLEKRLAERRLDLDGIASVASFFVSRVDTEIDKRLDKLGADALAARARPAIANAQLAYQAYEEVFASDRWQALEAEGRRAAAAAVGLDRRQEPGVQRHHVRQRADRARHGQHHAGDDDEGLRRPRRAPRRRRCRSPTTRPRRSSTAVADAGVDLDDVFQVLEDEGVQKFVDAWDELTDSVRSELEKQA